MGLDRYSQPWPLDAWIDQYREDAIEPERRIIDPHHHLFDPRFEPRPGWTMPRLLVQILFAVMPRPMLVSTVQQSLAKDSKASPLLETFGKRHFAWAQTHTAEDFMWDMQNRGGATKHNIQKTVYVECGWNDGAAAAGFEGLGEAALASDVHARHPEICHATIAFADLRSENIEGVLEAFARIGGVRGIRHGLAWTKAGRLRGADACDGDTAADPAFRRDFALLEKHGLSYDAWVFHEQLDQLADLARSFPGTTIVVNHVGMPLGVCGYDRHAVFPEWERAIRALADASPNVHVKLSGLGMRTFGFHFDERPLPPSSAELASVWRRYFSVCLDAFGARRCMFASNFPTDKISCDYTVLWNAFKIFARDLPEEEKDLLFYGNAQRVYRLRSDGGSEN